VHRLFTRSTAGLGRTDLKRTELGQLRHRRERGCRGSSPAGGALGYGSIGAAAARSQFPVAALEFDTMDDHFRPDIDHPAARHLDGHDAPGAAVGSVPFSASGAGHADRAVESHSAGTGADDDLVPDGAGPDRSRSAGLEAIDTGAQPVKHFMLRYAREKDLALFTAAGQIGRPNAPDDLPMRVVVPAYILSELKAGFSIGAVLFLPFLLIDIVTASITTSIGMFQLPPVVVSTPLKILLFVMVDGWNLLASSLLKSF
jgi:hypothetical protein